MREQTMHARESSLSRALSSARTSYHAAKAAVAERAVAGAIFAQQGAAQGKQADLSHAAEQERHCVGWVYAAVRAIASKCAAQPIRVGRVATAQTGLRGSVDVGGVVEIDDHPIKQLLADPNDLHTGWTLLFAVVSSLELTGRALLYVTDDGGRRQLHHIPTSWIERIVGGATIERFLVRPPGHAGEPLALDAEQCVYAFYPHPADPRGAASPLQAAAWAVQGDEQIQIAQYQTFKRGIFGQHAVIVGQNIDAEGKPTGARPTLSGAQQAQLIDAVRKRYSGFANAGEPLILDGLIEDVKRLTSTPAELDFLQSSELFKQRILQIFGVNEIVLGATQNANRASATVAEASFYGARVNPTLRLLGEAFTEWLGPMFAAKGSRLVIWFDPAVARDDELQLRRVELAMRGGALTVDELRRECGLLPFGGVTGGLIVNDDGGERTFVQSLRAMIGEVAARKYSKSDLWPQLAAEQLCGADER